MNYNSLLYRYIFNNKLNKIFTYLYNMKNKNNPINISKNIIIEYKKNNNKTSIYVNTNTNHDNDKNNINKNNRKQNNENDNNNNNNPNNNINYIFDNNNYYNNYITKS